MCRTAAAFLSGFQVQLVSGASPLAYWLSSYLWDAMLFGVLTVLVMLAFAAYGQDASKVLIQFIIEADYKSPTTAP